MKPVLRLQSSTPTSNVRSLGLRALQHVLDRTLALLFVFRLFPTPCLITTNVGLQTQARRTQGRPDEVSFISAAFIGMISQRFADIMGHPELPFGGTPVLLVGDNFQQAPVTGMPWFVSLVEDAHRDQTKEVMPCAQSIGVKILRQARRFVLQGNMRTMQDASFVDALHALRRTDISNPITPTFFDSIQYLSKSDACGRYRFGPFATKWRLTIVGTNSSQGSPPVQLLDDLYDTEPALFGYFVKEAPVLLTQNIQATRHLVNGTRAIMHSLMLRDAHD